MLKALKQACTGREGEPEGETVGERIVLRFPFPFQRLVTQATSSVDGFLCWSVSAEKSSFQS